jgi:hypothetical protein
LPKRLAGHERCGCTVRSIISVPLANLTDGLFGTDRTYDSMCDYHVVENDDQWKTAREVQGASVESGVSDRRENVLELIELCVSNTFETPDFTWTRPGLPGLLSEDRDVRPGTKVRNEIKTYLSDRATTIYRSDERNLHLNNAPTTASHEMSS